MARAYGARGETRGMLNFRVHMDDTQLIEALKDLQTEGQDELKKLIKEMMVEAKEVAEDLLLSQPISNNSNTTARSVRGVNVGGSENVYVRIADSLTISDDALFVRLFSAPYPGGYESKSRPRAGGKLAQIHAGGAAPFNYARNLPKIVRSSVWFFLKTGYSSGYTRWNRQMHTRHHAPISPDKDWRNRMHPGFPRVDFISAAQDYMEQEFEERAKRFIKERMG